jgi:FkbM family methyltransferase
MNIEKIGQILRTLPDFPGKGIFARTIVAPFVKGKNLECIIELKTPGGGKLICNLDDFLPWNLFIYGKYKTETKYEKFMLEKVKESQTVFDIGANIGYYSIQFARLTKGKVFSFEPIANQYSLLSRNIEVNHILNDIAEKIAISDSNEIKRFYLSENEETGTSSVEIPTNTFEDVLCTTLDDYCKKNGIESIDLIKIDVEGHELKVLRGMDRLLSGGKIKNIFIEIHTASLNSASSSPEELCSLLQSNDYYPHSIKTGEIEDYQIGNDESLVYFYKN